MESRADPRDLYAVSWDQMVIQEKQPQPLLETPKSVERLTNWHRFYTRTDMGLCVRCSSVLNVFLRSEYKKISTQSAERPQSKARRGVSYGRHFI